MRVAGWHKRASESAKASRFSPVPILIRIPRISSEAGKAGSSWRVGSGRQHSVLTPSYSPRTPPSRRDLFLTCLASRPARRENSSESPRQKSSTPHRNSFRFLLKFRLDQTLQTYTPVQSSHPRLNQPVLWGQFLGETPLFDDRTGRSFICW